MIAVVLAAHLSFTVPTLSARADSCAGGMTPAGAVEARVTRWMQSQIWLRYGEATVFGWGLWPIAASEALWRPVAYSPLRLDQAGQRVTIEVPRLLFTTYATVATRDSAGNWSCESNVTEIKP